MSVGTIKILLGIACIPLLLFLAGGVIYVYYLVYKWFIERLSRLRQLKMKFAKDTQTYKEVISSCHIEDEDAKKAREVENEFRKLTWGRILFMTHEHYITTAIITSFVVAIIFLLITFCIEESLVTNNERVVLAFVGILATFVVITNHAQSTERIKQLEKMLTKKETELKLAIAEQESNYKKEVKTAIQEVKKSHMSQTYAFIEACQDQSTYKLSKSIAEDLRNKKKLSYKIGFGKGKKSMTAKVHIQERVVFFTSTVSPFELISAEEINTINGVIYNQDFVNIIVSTLLQLKKEEGK